MTKLGGERLIHALIRKKIIFEIFFSTTLQKFFSYRNEKKQNFHQKSRQSVYRGQAFR